MSMSRESGDVSDKISCLYFTYCVSRSIYSGFAIRFLGESIVFALHSSNY